jgi:hypothetical protein
MASVIAIVACAGHPESAQTTVSIDSLSGVVTSGGPLLVGAFIATPSEIAADPEIAEAHGRFQSYLGLAADSLRIYGVRVALRHARPITIALAGDSLEWPVDSGRIAYLMVAPGRKPKTLHGVTTYSDLKAAATDYFAPRRGRP